MVTGTKMPCNHKAASSLMQLKACAVSRSPWWRKPECHPAVPLSPARSEQVWLADVACSAPSGVDVMIVVSALGAACLASLGSFMW